jgi:hydroxymethylglutaryl-CoA lyase
MGCREVSLGDTIGAATPDVIGGLLAILTRTIPAQRLAGHFHDTRGMALPCIEVALHHGLRVFDAAVAGAGGCPFAPGAPAMSPPKPCWRSWRQKASRRGSTGRG